jgi:hypothetical protein
MIPKPTNRGIPRYSIRNRFVIRGIATMLSSFSSRIAFAISVAFALTAPTWANPTLSSKQVQEARELVRQLGDVDFRVRDEATGKLVRMGSGVEPILREGLSSPDPEVRLRCRTIMPQARSYDLERRLTAFIAGKTDGDNPAPDSWDKFKELVGDSRHTRETFASMHRLDTAFMSLVESGTSGLQQRMAERCTEFSMSQNNASSATGPDMVALLLFASLEPRTRMDPRSTQQSLAGGLYTYSYKPRGKDMLKNDEVIHKLLVKYIADGTICPTYYALWMLANLELKEGVDILKTILKHSAGQPSDRATAVAIMGKIGGKANVSDIVSYLKDEATVGQAQMQNNVLIKTQVRDVALATLVLLSGQHLRDYDFPYAKLAGGGNAFERNFCYMTNFLGFVDDQTRQGAFKKWDAWYAKNKDTMTK